MAPRVRNRGQGWGHPESRQLFLGEALDYERVKAGYDSGLLTVTIPVAKQAKPRKVEISAGGGKATATAIDASSSGS